MLSGQGIGLPIPQAAFPTLPFNFAQQPASNQFTLIAGGCIYAPAGWWACYLGSYSVLEFLDPVSGQWLPVASATRNAFMQFNSDGNNWRIWNPKGFPVNATVTDAGTGYVQSSTTVTASAGGSLWHAIVGGAVGTVTVGNDSKGNPGGTNFTIPPTIVFSNPPQTIAGLPSTATAQGGVVATGHATISAGAITAITLDFAGAGYASPPAIQVIPNPFDPNIGLITVPSITCVLTGSGTVTAVIMDYFGTTAGSAPTLTIAGAGSGATATANIVATAASDTIILQPLGSWF
jgi:hypothetical protein